MCRACTICDHLRVRLSVLFRSGRGLRKDRQIKPLSECARCVQMTAITLNLEFKFGCSVTVMHEFLPAKQILHRRHIERIAACEVCGAERETIRHVLLECTVAKVFWEHTKKLAGVKLPHLH